MSETMKISVGFILICVIQTSAQGADPAQAPVNTEAKVPSADPFSGRAAFVENLPTSVREYRLSTGATRQANQIEQPADNRVRESAFAGAIRQAAKKGVIELGVEASAEVLIQCQKAQSVVLTTSFMRSDSQQAHCYRF
jgi:hypothetical protein